MNNKSKPVTMTLDKGESVKNIKEAVNTITDYL